MNAGKEHDKLYVTPKQIRNLISIDESIWIMNWGVACKIEEARESFRLYGLLVSNAKEPKL